MKANKFVVLSVAVILTVALLSTIVGCGESPSTASSTSTIASQSTQTSQVSSSDGNIIEYKLAHSHSAEAPLIKEVFEPWARDIEEATNGRVKITIYPGEALGPETTYVDAVKSGMIDIAWDSLEYFEGRFVLTMVGYYPLGAKTEGTISYVWWDLFKEFPEIQAEFEGMKVLAVDGSNAYNVFVSKKCSKEVSTIDDMKGLKLKAGGGTLNEAVKALGAAPVTIPAPQMYEALQKGTIDGAWFPPADGPTFMLQEVCKSVTMVDGPSCGFFTFMNEDAYARMTPEDQKIFDSFCGDSLVARAAKLRYDLNEKSLELLASAGVNVISPTPEEYAKFQSALDTMSAPWIEKMDSSGLPGTEVFNRAKELVAKWDASNWWE